MTQPISLSGGIYLQSTEFNYQTHMDSAHVKYLNSQAGIKPTNLGVVEHFITSGYLQNMGGVYDFTGVNPQVIEVDGGVYTWKTPMTTEDFYIVEDLSCTDYPGRDEQPFKIRFNRRAAGNTAVITHSPYAKFDLLVTEDEIQQDGKTWVYTVTLKGQGAKDGWFPKQYLVSGTRFTQKTSMHGDQSTIYNTIDMGATKMAEFYNYVGQTEANIITTVGGGASGRRIAGEAVVAVKDYTEVLEMYFFKPGSEGFEAQLRNQSPMQSVYKGDMKAANKDIVGSAWITAIDAMNRARLELDCVNEAVWGTGGTVTLKGQTMYSPIGLYHQLNRGNQHFYSIENMTITKFDGILSSFFAGRTQAYQNNVIEIVTGDGGISLVKKMTQSLLSSSGLVTNSERFLTGADPKDLHYTPPSITSFDFTFGQIKFKVNPALNPLNANDIDNPKIGAFRLSSYLFIITDVLGKNDNIKMLRNTDGWDFVHQYQNGKGNYLSAPVGTPGDMDKEYDYRVTMRKKHYAYWVQDPTRCFIIKPYNPITKKPFGEI